MSRRRNVAPGPTGRTEPARAQRKVLLISNRVMHYRVSVYNYFQRRFNEEGWSLLVRSNELEKANPHPLNFDFQEIEFGFTRYRREIERVNPDAVIVFLHLRDRMIWPLVHWLKWKKIPLLLWTKGLNLDKPDDRLSFFLYRYMHRLFDGLILYSDRELKYIKPKYQHKAIAANNTLNFEEFPVVSQPIDEIKQELGVPFRKVVLSVGRLGSEVVNKKIDHLVSVFENSTFNDAGLVVVGSDPSPSLLRRLEAGSNMVYLGEIHDSRHVKISRVFKMADVFCIPGHLGLALNQAFYWSLPVVTEGGRQPPEIHNLIDGRNGFIVPEGDIAELGRRIAFLLDNDDVRDRFSKNARQDILENASIEKMFAGFLQSLHRVAS